MPNIIRIRDLSTETDLANAYIPVDKSSYTGSVKKILMSDIANYVGVMCGVTFDIFTGELTIETNYGYYLTDLDGRYAVYLEDLQDVSGTTLPSGNDVLVYKSGFWTSVSNFISGLTFDIGTGILTLMTQIGNFSYDLDGRYAVELNDLIDVNAPSPTDNDVLVYSGGIWINSAATFGGGSSGSSGTSGTSGIDGNFGGNTLYYQFDDGWDVEDPPVWHSGGSYGYNVGYFSFSDQTTSGITVMNISYTEGLGFVDVQTWFNQFSIGSFISLYKKGEASSFIILQITGTTIDEVLGCLVPVVTVTNSGDGTVASIFLKNDDVLVSYTKSGINGTSSNDPILNGGWHYFGDENIDGTWRQGVSGLTFVTQIKSGGTWETKHIIS